MAFFEMHYYSEALRRRVVLNVLLPEKAKKATGAGCPDGKYKTVYLFHGLTGDYSDWIRKSNIERYAEKRGLAVIMPSVERSWFTNTRYGENYFTFVTEELPAVCQSYFRGMSDAREDNFVAGLSMGGYGAIKAALACPDKFFACASLSGSLDITRRGRDIDIPAWRAIFDFDLCDGEELLGSEHDVFELARKLAASEKEFPKMYLWCGTEDHLLRQNRAFRDLLVELGVTFRYEESEGNHSWPWWDLHIQDALKYILDEI